MFDLRNTEKFILIFLLASLLAGLSIKICGKNSGIVDVKIKSFDYEPSQDTPIIRVNINEADEEALAGLDGIGPSLAGRILAYRSERGGFGSVEELKKVKGIGKALFEKIKDEVSVE